ncbi:hypothetical protein BDR26DRAFT_868488, partial [Obelidium mucronatum]
MIKTLIVGSAVGVAATYALTTQLAAVPRGSLLAAHSAPAAASSSSRRVAADAFALRIPFALSVRNANDLARAFAQSPVFALERALIRAAGLNAGAESSKDVFVDNTTDFAVGRRMALWTVAARSESGECGAEVLLTWEAAGVPFCGATWLAVDRANCAILFGSSLSIPSDRSVSPLVLHLHYFYSRVLLVNTAATLLFQNAFNQN